MAKRSKPTSDLQKEQHALYRDLGSMRRMVLVRSQLYRTYDRQPYSPLPYRNGDEYLENQIRHHYAEKKKRILAERRVEKEV